MTDTTQRTEADEAVSNGDLVMQEVAEAGAAGEGEALAAGEGGVEAVIDLPAEDTTESAPEAEEVPSLAGLVDVAYASSDSAGLPVSPESVMGEDERVRISPASSHPWRVHCALRITGRDGSRWIGTAFFVSPRLLLTAGHCVFIRSTNTARHGWVRSIDVMPGRDGNSLPYGTARSTRFYSVRGWTVDGDDEHDYGAIVLDEPLGSRTGWLGFGTYSDSTLTSSWGNLAGYPGDRGGGAEQWYMARRIHSVGTRKLFYEIDTAGGQSGSAVYRIKDGQRHAMGIHAYGVGQYPRNSATRITRPAFDNILTWKDRHP
jgi:glutamyl endopeptidase